MTNLNLTWQEIGLAVLGSAYVLLLVFLVG